MRIPFVGAARFAIAAGACSSSQLGGSGTGGSGGATGSSGTAGQASGGASGTAGSSGGGVTGGGGAGVPSCLNALFAMCPTEGACQSPAGGGGYDVCFASGVRVATLANTQCGSNAGGRYAMSTTEVRKADGSICYTAVSAVDCTQGSEAGTVTWTDASGHEVAVETFGFNQWSIACSDTGQTNQCAFGCPVDAPGLNYGRNCTSGACP